MRGDRPKVTTSRIFRFSFTPHARGSTLRTNPTSRSAQVYPACAGIDLDSNKEAAMSGSLPRMRGDRPEAEEVDLDLS